MKIVDLIQTRKVLISWAVLITAALWVLIRVQGNLPAVMQDEYVYSMQARKIPLAEQDYPNYLHSIVYSATELCGTAFYSCAKTFNWVFLLGFVALIFLISRRLLSYWLSFALTLGTLLSPLSVYISLFTTESMYFFFALLALFLLWRAHSIGSVGLVIASGTALGLASLVKPHALFLIPAVILYLVFSQVDFRRKTVSVLGYVGTVFATNLVVGFLVAGPSGLSLFGPAYTSALMQFLEQVFSSDSASNALVSEAVVGQTPSATMLAGVLGSQLLWLFASLFLIAGGGLGLVLYKVIPARQAEQQELKQLTVLVGAAILSLALMIGLFGTLVTVTGDDHSQRVLLRYIEFLVPVVGVIGAGWISSGGQGASNSLRVLAPKLAFAVIGAASIVWFVNGRREMKWLYIDSPWLKVVNESDFMFALAAVVSLATVTLAFFSSKNVSRIFVGLIATCSIVLGVGSMQELSRETGRPSPSDEAGRFAQGYLAAIDPEQIMIVGPGPSALVAAFWLDKPGVEIRVLSESKVLAEQDIPEEVEWIIVLRSTATDLSPAFTITGRAWSLLNVGTETQHRFTQETRNSIVEETSGLTLPSQMGQRLSSETAKIYLERLPIGSVELELSFVVGATGAGKQITFEIGESLNTATLPSAGSVVNAKISFVTDGTGVLRIDVPGSSSNSVSLLTLRVSE